MRARKFLANALTGLGIGCIAGVVWLGARALLVEPTECVSGRSEVVLVENDPAAATHDASTRSGDASRSSEGDGAVLLEPLDDSSLGFSSDSPRARGREPFRDERDDARDRDSRGARVAADRRTERDYYREFIGLAAHGTPADVERAARIAVAGEGPDCEKIAALRAVSKTRCPGAFDLYADAVMTLPDVSRAQADSVPRYAMRALIAKASREEPARQALERIAWNRTVSSDLRRIAAAGLARVADEAGAWRIVSRLEVEQDAHVIESAARALAENSAAGPAALRTTQWIPASSLTGGAGEQQE